MITTNKPNSREAVKASVLLMHAYRPTFISRARRTNCAVIDCRVSNLQSAPGAENVRPDILAETLGEKYFQLKALGVTNEDSPSSYLDRVEPILEKIAAYTKGGIPHMLTHWDMSVLKVMGTLLSRKGIEVVVAYHLDGRSFDAPLKELTDAEIYSALKRYCHARDWWGGSERVNARALYAGL